MEPLPETSAAKFDVCMSWHVLEHVRDPASFLAGQFRRATCYVVAHVPSNHCEYNNYDHIWHFQERDLLRLFRKFAGNLQVRNHLYDLSRDTDDPCQRKATTVVDSLAG